MASIHAQLLGPFRRSSLYLVRPVPPPFPLPLTLFSQQQRQAHEQPAIFYSVVIGAVGAFIRILSAERRS